MSWFEVQKINSDFINEPLNFNNYINDISVFGDKSYVLDKYNKNLFRNLLTQSLTMFGHQEIHEYIYNRMTEEDVDVMIEGNARLGQALNSFYRTDIFTGNNVDEILSNIGSSKLNTLELKLQGGIVRYVTKKTSGEDAASWLQSVFNVDMSGFTTMESIINDTDFWNNTIMTNESLAFVVCLSHAAIDVITTMSGTKFVDFIRNVANSTSASTYLFSAFNNAGRLEDLFNDEEACQTLVSREECVSAILQCMPAFEKAMASQTMTSALIASTEVKNVVVDHLLNLIDRQKRLDNSKSNLDAVCAEIDTMPESEELLPGITDLTNNIQSVLTSISFVRGLFYNIFQNINDFVINFNAMSVDVRSHFFGVQFADDIEEKITNTAGGAFGGQVIEISQPIFLGEIYAPWYSNLAVSVITYKPYGGSTVTVKNSNGVGVYKFVEYLKLQGSSYTTGSNGDYQEHCYEAKARLAILK